MSQEALRSAYDDDPATENARLWAREAFASTAYAGFVKEAHDKPDSLPQGYMNWLAKAGLTSLELGEHTGETFTHQQQAAIVEEANRVDGGLGLNLAVLNSLTAFPLVRFGSEEQKLRYLPGIQDGTATGAFALTTVNKGSDAKGNDTLATRNGQNDGWLIKGEKMFITLGREAAFLLVTARTGEAADRGRNLSVFIVDTRTEDPHVRFQQHHKLGQAGSPLYQITFDNLPVPDSAVLGGERMIHRGWETLEATLAHSRADYIASQSVGMAQASLEEAVAYTNQRPMFGEKPLIELPMARNMLEVMKRQTSLVRNIVQVAALYEDARHPKAPVVASLAKLTACTTAVWAAIEADHLHGGNGYLPEMSPRMISLVLDSLVMPVYEGASPVQMGILEANGFSRTVFKGLMAPPLDAGYYMDPNDIMDPDMAKRLITSYFPIVR